MSSDETSSTFSSSRRGNQLSPMIPIAVIGASLIAMFTWQISGILSQSDLYRETKARYAEALQKGEEPVRQSKETQKKLQDILTDLLELAKTDEKAKAIQTKYGIQQNAQAAGADAAAGVKTAPTP